MGNSVKVSLIGDKQFTAKVMAVLKRSLDKETLDKCAEEILDSNVKAVKRGEAIGISAKFPPLSDSWIKRRKRLAETNVTGPGYGPRKSNITFTGQLIRAMVTKTNAVEKSIELFIASTTRRPYIGVKGQKLNSPTITNQQLGEYIAEKGIIFIGLTLQAKVRCNKIIERKVRSLIRLFR